MATSTQLHLRETVMQNMLHTMLVFMCQLQDQLNSKVNPNWKDANNNWPLAIQLEAAEAVEHLPWKWWKSASNLKLISELSLATKQKVVMELVDILHFWISLRLDFHREEYTNVAELVGRVAGDMYSNPQETTINNLLVLLQEIMWQAGMDSDAVVYDLLTCFHSLGYTPEQMCHLYLAKNVLNEFRQDNGYKEGTYVKAWPEGEDNDYLFVILHQHLKPELSPEDCQSVIYSCLAAHYQNVVLPIHQGRASQQD